MSEDFDVKQGTENIYKRWRYESTKEISDKHPKEDGETLERFYNRINLGARYLMIQKNPLPLHSSRLPPVYSIISTTKVDAQLNSALLFLTYETNRSRFVNFVL